MRRDFMLVVTFFVLQYSMQEESPMQESHRGLWSLTFLGKEEAM